MKKLLLLLIFLTLIGCDKFVKPPIISEKVVHVDSQILEQCEDLPLISDSATWEDILVNHKDIVELYSRCRQKQYNSTVLIKKFANIKETK